MARTFYTAAFVAALAGPAGAEACPPAVVLDGDTAVVGEIAAVLAARGIALDPPGCPAVAARVEHRGSALVVDVDGVERVVGDPATAATVIESFSRGDVGTPLLASRAVARPAPIADVVMTPSTNRSTRGIQLFSALETSFASDRTTWLGVHVGACVTLGPVCAAARLRVAGVTGGPGGWDGDLERHSIELLIGIDVPLAVHGVAVTPGFAAGLGQMHTGREHVHTETGGPRADVHVTVSIPVSRRFAIDLFGAVDLTQATHVEGSEQTALFPEEPRALLRAGAGLRFGGL